MTTHISTVVARILREI